jgi:hypothetical protein
MDSRRESYCDLLGCDNSSFDGGRMNHFKTRGYSEATCGFSGAFSWWRSDFDSKVWTIANHTGFGPLMATAVTNDYGDLVAV